ncbi:DUF1778 domain-containing protein [Microbacterium luticocti]|uniref:type II toxin-antitoxin system TacA family antitoxin n=1 Tax=Microbacterium luticocti TaxID=451764 RepID=UPI00041746F7|nr:DUF1778 domain-containing protein [Microbacterium luticocti]
MSESVTRPSRSQRINLRATARQEALLRRAADATDHTLTDFILDSAVDQAQQVLASRQWFAVSPQQFDEFVRMLDEPLPSTERFQRLFSRRSRFEPAG